jgi:hypothetical protein
MLRVCVSALAVLLLASGAVAEEATVDPAAAVMERFSGEWRGTGRVLVGPGHGVRFHCMLEGEPMRPQKSFAVSGKCWMGRLQSPVTAQLRYNPASGRFYGEFMDGGAGGGVDIVGTARGGGLVMTLTRGQAQGRLTAEPGGAAQMKVMISLHDRGNGRDVPVVAMGFARADAESLPRYDPARGGSLARID